MSNLTYLTLEKHGREIGALLASMDSSTNLNRNSVLQAIQYTCENTVYPSIESDIFMCLSEDMKNDEVMICCCCCCIIMYVCMFFFHLN